DAVTGDTFFSGTLIKNGTGTWFLDREMSMAATDVREGTLFAVWKATHLNDAPINIESGATLAMLSTNTLIGDSENPADVEFRNSLSGAGVFAFSNTGTNDITFTFAGPVASTFTGTAGFYSTGTAQTILTFDDAAETVLKNATLHLGQNGQTTLTADREIGALALAGGTLIVKANPDAPVQPYTLTVEKLLVSEASGTAASKIGVDTAILSGINPPMLPGDGLSGNIFDLDVLPPDYLTTKLVESTVSGPADGIAFNLVDSNGAALATGTSTLTYGQNGVTPVGKNTYGYNAITQGGDLVLNYGLISIEALSATESLRIDPAGSSDKILSAKLTGTGAAGFTFAGSETITLSHTGNDYTGKTLVTGSGTIVIAAVNNALGHTDGLMVDSGATMDFSDKTQAIAGDVNNSGELVIAGDINVAGAFANSPGGSISLAPTGALNLAGGGTIAGDNALAGSGALNVSGNTIVISGHNTGYTGTAGITGGILELPNPDALGGGNAFVDANGKLALAFDGTLSSEISGTGVITTNGNITLDRANPNYSGTATNQTGTLTIENPGALGTGNLVNNVGAVVETVNGFTGSIANAGTARLGNVYGSGTQLADVSQSGTGAWGKVANNGTIHLLQNQTRFGWGDFFNNGHLDFVNAGNKLYVDSLAGTGSLRMDVDALNSANSDELIIRNTVAAGAHQTLVLTDVTANPNAVTKDTTFKVVSMADGTPLPDGTVSGRVDIGLYAFDIGTAGAHGTAVANGYSSAGQAIVNTTGAIATSWFSQLDNLLKRMGELRLDPKGANGDFWLRGYGQQTNADLGIAGMSGFREYQYGADLGADWAFAFDPLNTVAVGAFIGYQGATRRFRDAYSSKGETDSVYGGVYATWMHNDGWYADGVLKTQRFHNSYDAHTDRGVFDNYGLGVSIELGKQFDFEDGWFAEPSLQFAYTHIFSESHSTRDSLRVTAGDSDIYRFAGVVRGGKTFDIGGGMLVQPYAKIGVEEQVSSGGSIRIADQRFEPTTDGTRGIVGAGVIWQLDAAQQIHLDYEASWGDKYDKPWGINAGYRLRF
ncbi:MAG: autotransporter outer membrane beta-barrel domain-containing protein, partial [Puniceicoccales bacterium]|nr:autotransporter outer membrane beta-barrel domain-containing protein [Puniceicoccales bacterium]